MALTDAVAGSWTLVSRRQFLRVGSLGAALGLGSVEAAAKRAAEKSCIMLFLNGGPSHLETFDPKPEAPLHMRGPFRPIATQVPGLLLSETLPQLAQRADRFSLLRSLWHDAAPIHETGQQLLETGHLARRGQQSRHLGAVIAEHSAAGGDQPNYVLLPRLVSGLGRRAGDSSSLRPCVLDPHRTTSNQPVANQPVRLPTPSAFELQRYGYSTFARSCLAAARLVETGVRYVAVNMYPEYGTEISWDCHGVAGSAGTLRDYRETVCPEFDRACAALLDDLSDRGLLEQTLVVAVGEFGRTPRINAHGGRDHWTGVWSALVAGGGTRGGAVIGASDPRGSIPAERPIALPELAATVLHVAGLDASRFLEASPISELL